MVYEPMILEDDMPPYQDFNEKDDVPAQDKIEITDDIVEQGDRLNNGGDDYGKI